MTPTTRTWLHSLAAAGIGGFSSAVLSALAMPDVVNGSPEGLTHAVKLALIGALVPVLTLLKQSPLPSQEATNVTGSKPD
jgi:hypothetical protein